MGGLILISKKEKGQILVMQMAHGKVNALDIELCQGLIDSLQAAENAPAKAVVLTGDGSIFSAGIDLFRLLNEDKDYTLRLIEIFAACLIKLSTFPKPVVAAINGHAIAGGCVLASACDYRVMAVDSGKIGIPELLVGVPFPSLALEILKTAIPLHTMQKLIFSTVTLAADEAAQQGLVDKAVPADKLIETACGVAEKYGALPANAFRVTKKLLRKPVLEYSDTLTKGLDREVIDTWTSDQTREHIRMYLEKTIGKKK
jgi:enoyl-CoA hydratase